LPKAQAQPTLATSGKIEQRFDWLSIGFLHCGDTSGHFKITLALESVAEICSRLCGLR
jgi:hypothetical protein